MSYTIDDTYSREPFLSHDAPDANGVRAEIDVFMGLGFIKSITERGSKNGVDVDFDIKTLKRRFYGATVKDDPIYEVIEDAYKNGYPLYYRLERVRRRGIDRSIPIKQLSTKEAASDSVWRNLVGVSKDNVNWVRSNNALTTPKEDPVSGSSLSMLAPENEAIIAAPRVQSTRSSEGKPWEVFNPNGSINVGSNAFAVPLTILDFLEEQNEKQEAQLKSARLQEVAEKLVVMLNKIQENVTGMKFDMTAGSHTRLRAVLFAVVRRTHPLTPLLESDDSLRDWAVEVRSEMLNRMQWAMGVSKNTFSGE